MSAVTCLGPSLPGHPADPLSSPVRGLSGPPRLPAHKHLSLQLPGGAGVAVTQAPAWSSRCSINSLPGRLDAWTRGCVCPPSSRL